VATPSVADPHTKLLRKGPQTGGLTMDRRSILPARNRPEVRKYFIFTCHPGPFLTSPDRWFAMASRLFFPTKPLTSP
jgi:hypothetical protein